MILVVLVSLVRLFWETFLCKMVSALRSLVHLLAEFRHCCMKTVLFFSTVLLLRVGYSAAVARGAYFSGEEGKRRETGVAGRACKSCNKMTPLEPDGSEDMMIKTVMDRLGVWVSSEEEENHDGNCRVGSGECGECRLVGAASCLLEEKDASLEELREAFSVFDRDGDGFITAVELGRVLQALGFGEGVGFQDCVLMIRAFDEDGDGRICLSEFKNMLQKAS